jgi:two-component system alkaline phosphatase synthesis response regulator PhoP
MDKKCILVVDDEKEWVSLMSTRLQHEGYHVDVAFDSIEGMAQAIKLAPDIILLDIMMPAGGGIAMLKSIRNSSKTFNIPVIVITAKSDKATQEEAEKLGVSGYFYKPLDTAKLIEKIKELLQ